MRYIKSFQRISFKDGRRMIDGVERNAYPMERKEYAGTA